MLKKRTNIFDSSDILKDSRQDIYSFKENKRISREKLLDYSSPDEF